MQLTTAQAAAIIALLTAKERMYISVVCRYPKPNLPDIAVFMDISVKTVQKHADKVYKKLKVQCHSDMKDKAIVLGLVKCQCKGRHKAKE